MGFIVPKYTKTAVRRNQLKRRLKEIIRTEILTTLAIVDVIIRARPNAYDAQFSVLASELKQALGVTGQAVQ